MLRRYLQLTQIVAITLAAFACTDALAQDEQTTIYLDRKPLTLRAPEKYQVSLAIQPKTSVTLTATASGPVQTVLCELGKKVTSQAELIRLDADELRLQVDRAKAAVELAKASGDGDAQKAAVAVAELDLKIAQLRLERATVVAPFDGTVIAVAVVPGQFVREASPLVTVIDSSVVTARLPAERESAKVGETIPVTIEGQPYDAKITAVLPLDAAFEPLRDLFESIVTVAVEFDNGSGQLIAGQTIRTGLIPRDPVAEVPNGAVSTDENGNRRVFVIREDIAVSVPVQVLSPVGTSDTFVSGEFANGDELVTAGADQLVSGSRVVPASEAPPAQGTATTQPGRAPGRTNPVTPAVPTGGF